MCCSSRVISLPFIAVPATGISPEGSHASSTSLLMSLGKTAVPLMAPSVEMDFQNFMAGLLPGLATFFDAVDGAGLSSNPGGVPRSAGEDQQNRKAPLQTVKAALALSSPLAAAGADRKEITREPDEEEDKKESSTRVTSPIAVGAIVEQSHPQTEYNVVWALPSQVPSNGLPSGVPASNGEELRQNSPMERIPNAGGQKADLRIDGTQPVPLSQPLFPAPQLPASLPVPHPEWQASVRAESFQLTNAASGSRGNEQVRPWEAAFALRLESGARGGERTAPRTRESLAATKEQPAGGSTEAAPSVSAPPRMERRSDVSPAVSLLNESRGVRVRRIPEAGATPGADGFEREASSHSKISRRPQQDLRAAQAANPKAPNTQPQRVDTAIRNVSPASSEASASADRLPERPRTKTESISAIQPGKEMRIRDGEVPPLTHLLTGAPRVLPADARKPDGPSSPAGEASMAEAAPQVETRYVAAPVRETKQITLPLDSVGMRDIEVRLLDQGGRVQVSVHSPDREIRGTLRANLEELIGSLEIHGIRAEMAGGREPSSSSPSDAGSAREMWLKDDSGLLQATTRDFDASRQQQQQQQRTPWLPQTESKKPAPPSADAWQQVLEASWQTPS